MAEPLEADGAGGWLERLRLWFAIAMLKVMPSVRVDAFAPTSGASSLSSSASLRISLSVPRQEVSAGERFGQRQAAARASRHWV
jgi:hypothetical protein